MVRKTRAGSIIGGMLGLMVATLWIYFTFSHLSAFTDIYVRGSGLPVEGTVVKIVHGRRRTREQVTYVAEGRKHTVIISPYLFSANVGDRVSLLYDSEDVETVMLDSAWRNTLETIAYLFFILLFLAGGIENLYRGIFGQFPADPPIPRLR